MIKSNIKKLIISLIIITIFIPTAFAAVATNVPVTGVNLDQGSMTIKRHETATLTAVVLPADAANKNVSWDTSDSDIVDIIAVSGLTATIEAYNGGEAIITVTTEEGNFSSVCRVTVLVPVSSVQLEPREITFPPGEEYLFEARVKPEDASNQDIIWQSSDNRVLNVDEKGLVNTYAAGEARVIARSAENEEIFSYSNVTVSDSNDVTEVNEEDREEPLNDAESEQEEDGIEEEAARDHDQQLAAGENTFIYVVIGAALLLIIILAVFIIRQRRLT